MKKFLTKICNFECFDVREKGRDLKVDYGFPPPRCELSPSSTKFVFSKGAKYQRKKREKERKCPYIKEH